MNISKQSEVVPSHHEGCDVSYLYGWLWLEIWQDVDQSTLQLKDKLGIHTAFRADSPSASVHFLLSLNAKLGKSTRWRTFKGETRPSKLPNWDERVLREAGISGMFGMLWQRWWQRLFNWVKHIIVKQLKRNACKQTLRENLQTGKPQCLLVRVSSLIILNVCS